jgi:hypothetical protein
MRINTNLVVIQSMCKRLVSYILFSLTLVITLPKPSHSIPTKWEDANISMSALLDSGWQITSHGFNRVAANSNSGNGFDEKVFTFLLTNGRKHIICLSDNPKPPIANASSCRKLN